MDEDPNPGENEKAGHDWAFFAIRMKNMTTGGLVGFMARDALTMVALRVSPMFKAYEDRKLGPTTLGYSQAKEPQCLWTDRGISWSPPSSFPLFFTQLYHFVQMRRGTACVAAERR
jgi:hypothetical protein